MIKIIYANESHKLRPEQWVNIYQLSQTGDAEFYDCCQVADLDLEDPSEYGLELIDAEKVIPIGIGEALK